MDYESRISAVVREIPPSGIRKYFDLLDDSYISPVSYTHLTLPTILRV